MGVSLACDLKQSHPTKCLVTKTAHGTSEDSFFWWWVGLDVYNFIIFIFHKSHGCGGFCVQPRHWSAGVVFQGVEEDANERNRNFELEVLTLA